MPFFYRRKLDGSPLKLSLDGPELKSAYPAIGALLRTLRARSRAVHRSDVPREENVRKALRGDRTEGIIFGLGARATKGLASLDEFNFLPTSIEDDMSGSVDGLLTGFDLTVQHRQTNLEVHAQIKTTRGHLQPYSPDITLVVLSEIANVQDSPVPMYQLEDALIADSENNATQSQIDRIEEATERLNRIYFKRLVELSEKQKTA